MVSDYVAEWYKAAAASWVTIVVSVFCLSDWPQCLWHVGICVRVWHNLPAADLPIWKPDDTILDRLCWSRAHLKMGKIDLTSVRDSSDQLVKSVQCYNPKTLYLHGYIAPFVFVYILLFSVWFTYFSHDAEFTDYYFITIGALVFVQILVYLSSLWSVHCYAFLAFSKVIRINC